ncbi:hypothetical protein [Actinacidiphila acididurans]|uniref:Lipoprotein n=1 Tax=Actinacidiphila acididurans TaxID=2784346 RepID=A0ABS2U573_9ACTN|nr:hypothetical protein [Actinacidiphila acididurans]MBM9509288.1 hypothetical protein [Actinacidiphila acididurans]
MDVVDTATDAAPKAGPSRVAAAIAAALAIGLLLTGCSDAGHSGSGPDSPAVATTDGAASPSASATAWPTEPSSANTIPPDLKIAPIAAGYTGASFVTALARTWHITLSARKRSTQPGEAPVRVSGGVAHPAKNQTVGIDVVWDEHGNLENLVCRATSGYTALLRDCVRLDYPGAKPQAALGWLTSTTPRMDAAFKASSGRPVVSPLFRNGPAATHLDEQNVKEYGGLVRMTGTFGTSRGAAR